jgi:large subunit ribosomal protein L13
MTKTTFATLDQHREAMNRWFVVDASKYVLGRMAARIAEVLMGKHIPLYTPHLSVGCGVIVVNASKVVVSGNKKQTRVYRQWSGFPGGLKETSLGDYLEGNPEELVKNAVKRMLPKSALGRSMLKRLKVYAGPVHDHGAQRPVHLEIPGGV